MFSTLTLPGEQFINYQVRYAINEVKWAPSRDVWGPSRCRWEMCSRARN